MTDIDAGDSIVELAAIGRARLRPVRPSDDAAFLAAFDKLSPEDVRMRFFAPLRRLPDDMVERLTHFDREREMAFVLERLDDGAIIGVGRVIAEPDGGRAEFALIVRSDLKGHGIGRLLMRRLIDEARARGVRELYGDILRENAAMIAFVQELGFAVRDLDETDSIVRAALRL